MNEGLLIAVEGIDGAGTTSQAVALADYLRARGWDIHLTAEPSPGPVGRMIRGALAKEESFTSDTLALLFAADRLDHLDREIQPALARGATVLTDRYLLSSLAYQTLGTSLEWVREINARARPADLTVFLRVSVETALGRRQGRGGAEELFDPTELQRQIAAAYDTHSQSAEIQAVVVDAEEDADTVQHDLRKIVEELLVSQRPSSEGRP